jgi:hypothetical protein
MGSKENTSAYLLLLAEAPDKATGRRSGWRYMASPEGYYGEEVAVIQHRWG